MDGNERQQGEGVNNKTIEERLEYLEAARKRDDQLTKSAAGQLRRAKNATTIDELKEIMLAVAGQLDPRGQQ